MDSESSSTAELERHLNQGSEELADLLRILDKAGGSGSGGLITEILEFSKTNIVGSDADKAATTAGVNNKTGSYNMVSGNVINTTMGARFDHCFNPRITTTADIEGLIVEALAMAPGAGMGVEMLSALTFGAGGFFALNYGINQVINYGPQIRVQRGEATMVNLDHFWTSIADVKKKVHSPLGVPILVAVHIAVLAMAIVALLFDIAIAIAMKWRMESPYKKSE